MCSTSNKFGVSSDALEEIRIHQMESWISGLPFYFLDTKSATDEVKQKLYTKYRNQFVPPPTDQTWVGVSSRYWRTAYDIALLDFLSTKNLRFDRTYAKNITNMYDLLGDTYKHHPAMDLILGNYIIETASLKGWNNEIEQIATAYSRKFPEENQTRLRIEAVRKKLRDHKLKVPSAYAFTLKDTLERTVSLKAFKGKVILLDFMFTGCGGCAAIRPKLEALEHKFKGEDIAFISISIDKTMDRFKKGIGKYSSRERYRFTRAVSEVPIRSSITLA